MSSVLQIALVAEGPTDAVVIDAALSSMLAGQPYILKQLQPESSAAFAGSSDNGKLGGGWGGVYKWCQQTRERAGGQLRGDVLFSTYDILVLHLDADVAGAKYSDISEQGTGLPCEQPCPPASASTDPLRLVLLGWAGETQTPPRTVLCTPSKSTEVWVLRALVPTDQELERRGWECHPRPADRLASLPKNQRFKKVVADYQLRKPQLIARWPQVAEALSEANRFQAEFQDAAASLLPPDASVVDLVPHQARPRALPITTS